MHKVAECFIQLCIGSAGVTAQYEAGDVFCGGGRAVGAAAAGLVNPLVAAVLMPLSSGLVIWGAFRVERMVRAEES